MSQEINIEFLKENELILFEVVSGSKAYGLSTPESDTDIKGVYYLPKEMFYGNQYISQVSNSSNDIVYYEIGRYIDLLCKNNPNILEMLFTPKEYILYRHQCMNLLNPSIFLSKLAKDTFAGYAFSQIKKARGLNKKINFTVPVDRLGIADFCYVIKDSSTLKLQDWLMEQGRREEHIGLVRLHHTKGVYSLFYDENAGYKGVFRNEESNDVLCSPVDKHASPVAYLFFNKEAYSAHCKSYKEYWDWVQNRNENRFNINQKHQKGYDAKNMMHTIRLLQQAKELFETGTFNIHRVNREQLLAIRNGQWNYDDLLDYADQLMKDIDKSVEASSLPDFPDEEKARALLVAIREELYQKHHGR